MKHLVVAILPLLAFGAFLSWQPAQAASPAQMSVEAECGSLNPAKGEGKFTGQISEAPSANSFQITAGNQTARVTYTNSVLVCEGGQPTSPGALVPGASVVAFGPMKANGNTFELTATKIVIAGPPKVSPKGGTLKLPPFPENAPNGAKDEGTASAQESSAAPGPVILEGNHASQGNGSTGMAAQSNSPGLQTLGSIACNSLQFGVSGGMEAGGAAGKRSAATAITCRRGVDPATMQLMQDAMTGKRLGTLPLTCKGLLEATLTNAEVTSVTFKTENNEQIVDVAFTAERAEILHTPSGMRVVF